MRNGMRPTRILIVDDEHLIVYALTKALEREGVEIVGAGSAEEALAEIERGFCDLCFLDLRLPGMGGFEALRLIRLRSPATKIVVMTANCLGSQEQSAIQGVAAGFIEKPFDIRLAQKIADRALRADGNQLK